MNRELIKELKFQIDYEQLHAKTCCDRTRAMIMLGIPTQAGREASFAATAIRRVRILKQQLALAELRATYGKNS